MSVQKSYGQILKASSIMGGAAGINLLLSMLRVKFAAVLIGTTGVGLHASFTAIYSLIGNIASLGLQSSAVRDIAVAVSKDDQQAIARIVLTLRRICWITGLIGMATMMLISPFISQITFDHQKYALDIAALGIVILFANITGGEMALIQGTRRIGDMAQANIYGAAFGTLMAVGWYAVLGLRGVAPALITASATQLALTWFFSRKVTISKASLTLRQTFSEASAMIQLGLVMMFNGLLVSAVTYITVIVITKQAGVDAVGLYSAAFALSGIFVNFVLSAMAADYYPRLTGIASEKSAMNHLVNEQSEIAILLALPGLLASLALAPWIVKIFYSQEFIGAVKLLQWFILGCMGRVISWPLGYVMLALGKGRWFLLTETSFNLLHVGLIILGLHIFGIEGVAIAFFMMYLCYVVAVYFICRNLTGFVWSSECTRCMIFALPALGLTFIACRLLPIWPASLFGFAITLITSIFCLRGLATRIGPEHRITRALARLPGAKTLLLPR
jgi:enterobacterial common antigen flippase